MIDTAPQDRIRCVSRSRRPAPIFRPARPWLRRALLAAGIAVLAASISVSAARAAEDEQSAEDARADVLVMSFNIRYGTAADGENHWDLRKAFLAETIKACDPDLLGTQETIDFQRGYLAQQLPRYAHLGVGREDGGRKGEMMALFYRQDRFEEFDGGHFWLSETPEQIGSKSWDSSLPRMVTWVKLRDRRQPSARPLVFANTHFDHRGPVARLESARLVRRQLEKLGQGCSIILTGDFNAGEGSQPYQALFGDVDGKPSPLIDAYRVAHPDATPDEGTFSGFKAGATGGARIDWVGVSRDWQVLEARIDRTARDGRTPSDHYPVVVKLRRKG